MHICDTGCGSFIAPDLKSLSNERSYLPVVEPHEEESAQEAVGDEDGVLTTVPLPHVSVQGLQEGGHTVKHVCPARRSGKGRI